MEFTQQLGGHQFETVALKACWMVNWLLSKLALVCVYKLALHMCYPILHARPKPEHLGRPGDLPHKSHQ